MSGARDRLAEARARQQQQQQSQPSQQQQSYQYDDNNNYEGRGGYYTQESHAQPSQRAPTERVGLPSNGPRPGGQQRRPTNPPLPQQSQRGREESQYAPSSGPRRPQQQPLPPSANFYPPVPSQQPPRQQQSRGYSSSPEKDKNGFSVSVNSVATSAPDERYEMQSRGNMGGGGYNGSSQRGGGDRGGARSEGKSGKGVIRAGEVPFEDMTEFFSEISSIQTDLRSSNDMISQIQSAQLRFASLASSEDPAHSSLQNSITNSSQSLRSLFSSLQIRIRNLEQGNANLRALIPVGQSVQNLSLSDVTTRKTQVDALKEKLREGVQRYAEVERDLRVKSRQRMERQIRIVNPDLGQGEVDQMVRQAEENGGQGGMFAQALMSNQRSYAARTALNEVTSRAAEIRRIEETLTELAQLFNDMAILVEAQDVQIVQIERNAEMASTDVGEGVVQIKKAVVSAKSARKLRWWCFGITMVVLIIVAVIVLFEVVLPIIRKNQSSSSSSSKESSSESSSSSSSSSPSSSSSSNAKRDVLAAATTSISFGSNDPPLTALPVGTATTRMKKRIIKRAMGHQHRSS